MQFWNKKNSYHIDSEKNPKKFYGNPTWPNISYEGFKVSKSKNSIFLFSSHESMLLDAEQFTFVLVTKKLNSFFSKLPRYSETVSKIS